MMENMRPDAEQNRASGKEQTPQGSHIDPQEESLSEALRNVARLADKKLDRALDRTSEVIEAQAGVVAKKVGSATKWTKDFVEDSVPKGLSALATNPELSPSLIANIYKVLPIVGATKLYADAWAKYHLGVQNGDTAMINQAKKDALVAFGVAGVDAVTFGVGILTRVGLAFKGHAAKNAVRWVHKMEARFLDAHAEKLLTNPGIHEALDLILSRFKPIQRESQNTSLSPEQNCKI